MKQKRTPRVDDKVIVIAWGGQAGYFGVIESLTDRGTAWIRHGQIGMDDPLEVPVSAIRLRRS